MLVVEIGTAVAISAYIFRHIISAYSLNVPDPFKGQPVQLSDYLFVFGCGLVFWLSVMLRAKLHDSGDRQADIREVAKLAKLIAPITTLNLCGCLLAPFMKLPLLVRFLVLFQVSSNLALLLFWTFLSPKEYILPGGSGSGHGSGASGSGGWSEGGDRGSDRDWDRGARGSGSDWDWDRGAWDRGARRRGSDWDWDRGARGSGHGSGASGRGSGSDWDWDRGAWDRGARGRGSDWDWDRGASGSGHGSGGSGSGGGNEGGDRGSDGDGYRGASGSGQGSGVGAYMAVEVVETEGQVEADMAVETEAATRAETEAATGMGTEGQVEVVEVEAGARAETEAATGVGTEGQAEADMAVVAEATTRAETEAATGMGTEEQVEADMAVEQAGPRAETEAATGVGTEAASSAFESPDLIKLFIALIAQTTGTLMGFHVIPTPSSSSKVLLVVALMDQLVAYLCGVTGILLSSDKPENSKAAKTFAFIEMVCYTLGYILMIGMYVAMYVPWYSVLIVVLFFGVVWLILRRKPGETEAVAVIQALPITD